MRESEIESAVVEWARSRSVIVLKLSGPGDRGKPDRMFLMAGRAAFVEFKAPGCKPTPVQRRWMKRLEAEGFGAEVHDDAVEAMRFLKNQFNL